MCQVVTEKRLLQKRFKEIWSLKECTSKQFLLWLSQLNFLMMDAQHIQHWTFQSQCIWKAQVTLTSTLNWPCSSKKLRLWSRMKLSWYCHNIEAFDRTLCNLFRSILSFGATLVLLLFEFRQILPVLRAANWFQIISLCFKRSPSYSLY